jgi:hypothetical protein
MHLAPNDVGFSPQKTHRWPQAELDGWLGHDAQFFGQASRSATMDGGRRRARPVIYDEVDGLNFYPDYGRFVTYSPSQRSRPTSDTRTCCVNTCGRR